MPFLHWCFISRAHQISKKPHWKEPCFWCHICHCSIDRLMRVLSRRLIYQNVSWVKFLREFSLHVKYYRRRWVNKLINAVLFTCPCSLHKDSYVYGECNSSIRSWLVNNIPTMNFLQRITANTLTQYYSLSLTECTWKVKKLWIVENLWTSGTGGRHKIWHYQTDEWIPRKFWNGRQEKAIRLTFKTSEWHRKVNDLHSKRVSPFYQNSVSRLYTGTLNEMLLWNISVIHDIVTA